MHQSVYVSLPLAVIFLFCLSCVTEEKGDRESKHTFSFYSPPNEAHCNESIITSKDDSRVDNVFKNLGVDTRKRRDVGNVWDIGNPRPDEFCFRKICDPKSQKCVELGKKELKVTAKTADGRTPASLPAGNLFPKKNPESEKQCFAGDLSACSDQFQEMPDSEKESIRGRELYAKFCGHEMFRCFKHPKRPTEKELMSMKGWHRWTSESFVSGKVMGYSVFKSPDYNFKIQK